MAADDDRSQYLTILNPATIKALAKQAACADGVSSVASGIIVEMLRAAQVEEKALDRV